MSFFNKIFKGLGFEVEEEPKKNIDDNFEKSEEVAKPTSTFELQKKDTLGLLSSVNVTPTSQNEVQSALAFLKEGQVVVIDLCEFESDDMVRAMDFIAGYCFCLQVSITKLTETSFELKPDLT